MMRNEGEEEMRCKRSEATLVAEIERARALGHSEARIHTLESTLRNKREDKKTSRILAAHKRWMTIKSNRAARQMAEAAL